MGYKEEIKHRLIDKPHLIPVFTNVYHIPERLRAYDSNLFVVFNTLKQWHEVHTLANKDRDTFGLCIPYSELDARAEYLVRRNNIRVRGKEIFREMDEHNEKLERSIERAKKNEREAVARDIRPVIKKLAWEL